MAARLKAVLEPNGFVGSVAVVVVDLDEKGNGRHWREILATGLTRDASQRIADEWNEQHGAT
jgi:hypothetical protein